MGKRKKVAKESGRVIGKAGEGLEDRTGKNERRRKVDRCIERGRGWKGVERVRKDRGGCG